MEAVIFAILLSVFLGLCVFLFVKYMSKIQETQTKKRRKKMLESIYKNTRLKD